MAESDAGITAVRPAQLTRRMIIGLGLAAPTLAVPGLAGCSSSGPEVDTPVVTPSSAPESSPAPGVTPTPNPTAAQSTPAAAAAPEQALSALAAAILVSPQRKQLPKDRRNLLTFLRNAHAAHARAIVNPLPSQAPAKLGGQSLNSSLALLARRETAAASRYRRAALQAKGSDALLWGSLAVGAASFAAAIGAANPPRTRSVGNREPVEILSEVAAIQELVRQLHAVVYGYQLAIGKMKVLSKQRTKAEQELLNHRIFRDRLIAWLRRRSAEVPAAEPAYVPSVVPRNQATAEKLIMQMQTALQAFCGLWLAAAASRADRQQALSALSGAVKTARSWGAPLAAWPGWSS
ncbi:MAG TPA: DUF4439 domain-containing protein [Propionibacteriaceae bacterium]|nr:DUF4439 domain-containing protein [Propionibacteriaceae bacterium]